MTSLSGNKGALEGQREERIVRRVGTIGNGAHVFAPKEWIGEEVIVIRKPRGGVRERILEVLEPYLDEIIGVYLYGSQARGDANDKSDIDVLVIGKRSVKLKKKGFEIIWLSMEDLYGSIAQNKIMFLSIFKEAKAIINKNLLEELGAAVGLEKKDVKEYVQNTEKMLKRYEKLIRLDRKTKDVSESAFVYSVFLRMRGIFIIKNLEKGKAYSKKEFQRWMIHKLNINKKDFNVWNDIYRDAKVKKSVKKRGIKIEQIESAIRALKEEIGKLR